LLPAELDWMKHRDPYCNVGEAIAAKIGVNLHRQPNHPLHIIKTKIESYFDDLHENQGSGDPNPHALKAPVS
jgi:hypothetical protein